MLEVSTWVQAYFKQSPDAIMLFKNDDLLVSNRLAQRLLKLFSLQPDYLLTIAKNAWSQQSHDDCASCIIKHSLKAVTVPLTLKKADTSVKFALIYQPLDLQNHIFALTIENQAQQARLAQLEQHRLLNRYVNEAHEKERQHISQDLHDSVAQGIYSAIMGIQRLSKMNDQAASDQLGQALEKQLQATLQEIKTMALNIRPSVLDSFGLIPAIKALAKRTQTSTGITVHVVALTDAKLLGTNIQNVLYRICQEAINNAIKHANPTEINLIITAHQGYLQLEILDNGKGFKVQDHSGFNGHSLGLLNMNERVKAYNGDFKINSTLNQGTTITVRLPYNNVSKDTVK